MGRKIPAKKHRGVKDPLVQQARRLQSLKSKINAPPKDPDEQPVPRTLTRLFEFQNKRKDNKLDKVKKNLKRLAHSKGSHNERGINDNPISRLRKLPGETGRDFSLRINSAIKALHNPTEQLEYPQDLMEEEDEKGARMAAQRQRRANKRRRAQRADAADQRSLSDQRDHSGQRDQHDHSDHSVQLRPTRAQRRALKNNNKKLEAIQEQRELVYERVPFGAVCHAPPALRFNTRNNRNNTNNNNGDADGGAPRPGRRDLLLTKMLGGGKEGGATAADALRRERARLDAVAAYRQLRARAAHAH